MIDTSSGEMKPGTDGASIGVQGYLQLSADAQDSGVFVVNVKESPDHLLAAITDGLQQGILTAHHTLQMFAGNHTENPTDVLAHQLSFDGDTEATLQIGHVPESNAVSETPDRFSRDAVLDLTIGRDFLFELRRRLSHRKAGGFSPSQQGLLPTAETSPLKCSLRLSSNSISVEMTSSREVAFEAVAIYLMSVARK
ncbi:MAG: hypothetical protein KDA96_04085 [Planctomycetaceae bacterium]|nr:hypothetical protein [Planctomycetaceae bacterium]